MLLIIGLTTGSIGGYIASTLQNSHKIRQIEVQGTQILELTEQLCASNESHASEVAALNRRLSLMEQEKDGLEAQLSLLQDETVRLGGQISGLVALNDTNSETISSLQADLEIAITNLENYTAEISTLTALLNATPKFTSYSNGLFSAQIPSGWSIETHRGNDAKKWGSILLVPPEEDDELYIDWVNATWEMELYASMRDRDVPCAPPLSLVGEEEIYPNIIVEDYGSFSDYFTALVFEEINYIILLYYNRYSGYREDPLGLFKYIVESIEEDFD